MYNKSSQLLRLISKSDNDVTYSTSLVKKVLVMVYTNESVPSPPCNGSSDTNTTTTVTYFLLNVSAYNYWVLTLLIIPALTVFGNILVCLSVYKERSLRTVTNYFIVSLAIADIMVAILVMPLAVYVEV